MRSGRVHLLYQRAEGDAPLLQVGHDGKQVRQGAAKRSRWVFGPVGTATVGPLVEPDPTAHDPVASELLLQPEEDGHGPFCRPGRVRVRDERVRRRRNRHAALETQYNVLHKRLLDTVRDDTLCRRLMSAPGIGPVIALTFQATVDIPACFARSRLVDAHFSLTPKRYASSETDHNGRISKCGDAMMRTALFEGAQALLVCTRKWSSLKTWGMAITRRRGLKHAIVAVARKLAVIRHRMWLDSTEFRWGKDTAATT